MSQERMVVELERGHQNRAPFKIQEKIYTNQLINIKKNSQIKIKFLDQIIGPGGV